MLRDMMKAATLWQRAGIAQMELATSAAVVIQIRVAQMWLGTMSGPEAMRMMLEKPSAFARGWEMAMRAAAANKGHAAVYDAGLKPVRARARANATRLTRRRR